MEVQSSYHVQQALALQHALNSGNYVAFFKLVRGLPYLLACLAHTYFSAVWDRALQTLIEGADPSPLPFTLIWCDGVPPPPPLLNEWLPCAVNGGCVTRALRSCSKRACDIFTTGGVVYLCLCILDIIVAKALYSKACG